jgi:2-(1,2-epoxy-1,2-dihydrophenyl)acetyl-CoA isomerase
MKHSGIRNLRMRTSEFETVIVNVEDSILKITLNRPKVLNAANDKMRSELSSVLKRVEEDSEIRCLILTGAGRAFCAGEDVTGFRARNFRSLGDLLRLKYNPMIMQLRRMEKPVIAAVNGIAAGAGASLALGCDMRVTSEYASFSMAFIRMGLVPDAGSSYFLNQLIGPGRAMELVMTGRTISAQEALQMGLVNKVVPAPELSGTVHELAVHLASSSRKAIGLSKRVMNHFSNKQLAEALEYEAEIQQIASETNDHREAVEAFLEKRSPQFA